MTRFSRFPVLRAFSLVVLGLLVGSGCTPSAPDLADRDLIGPATFSVTLAWDAPTTDANGAPLDDLASYRLYMSPGTTLDPAGSATTVLDLGLETTRRIEGLEPGAYVFAVSAIDASGNESALSDEMRVVLGGGS